ncbi:MAG: hypothetical protein E7438_01070 [Ruminococcaceae bacterium]|nr:hypothetical protein [Oscillospiraceae bacterium]
MRIFNQYTFTVGNIPFGDIFDVVDRFLEENHLTYEKLGYAIYDCSLPMACLIDIAQQKHLIPRRKSATVSDMHNLYEDYPSLENVRDRAVTTLQSRTVISNMDARGVCIDDSCSVETLREIGKQYPLPYFVDGMLFSFLNVDFFHRVLPDVEIGKSWAPWDVRKRKASAITFCKEAIFGGAAKLTISVDVTDGDSVLDATAYAYSMGNLLGKKYTAETVLHLTQEEQLKIDILNRDADPYVQAARDAFQAQNGRFGEIDPPWCRNLQGSNFTVDKSLKKIGKEYGFTIYHYNRIGVHYLSKRTVGGHLLSLCIDTPAKFNELRLYVSLDGFGFSHKFRLPDVYGRDQDHADFVIRESLEIIQQLEEQYILPICEHYPPTPQWYEIDVF